MRQTYWMTTALLLVILPVAIVRDYEHHAIAWYHWLTYPVTMAYLVWAAVTLIKGRKS